MFLAHVTVAAIIEHNDHFLMVKEYGEGRIVYNQPAGHLEENESLTDAAIRETLEETGWSFTPEAVTGVYLYTSPHNQITYLRVCFMGQAEAPKGEVCLAKEIIEAQWIPAEQLDVLPLRSQLVKQCITDYRAGARYPLSMLHRLLPTC